MEKKTIPCSHCGAEVTVYRNGKKLCHTCGKTFVVSGLQTKSASRTKTTSTRRQPSGEVVAPVQQPDDVSCGWATALWLLRSFGIDVDPGKLREELNVDGNSGIRGTLNDVVGWLNDLTGLDIPRNSGTLPWTMYNAFSKRGLTLKNPVRAESPTAFTDYLKDTFRAGGRAVMLLWRMDGLLHWMGVDEKGGKFRVMDPAHGAYFPFNTALANWNTRSRKANFIVFGIVRD